MTDPTQEVVRIARDERAAIVAWLRGLAGQFVTPSILAFFGDPFSRDTKLACTAAADAIERGEHLQESGE